MNPPDEKPRCAICGLPVLGILMRDKKFYCSEHLAPSPVVAEAKEEERQTGCCEFHDKIASAAVDAGRAMTKHSHAASGTTSRTYRSWESMLTRCTNPNAQTYRKYGARGITFCERWRSFPNFLADMGERPADGPWKVYALCFGDPTRTTFCYGRAGSAGVILFEFDEEWRARDLATALQEVVNPDPKAGATATAADTRAAIVALINDWRAAKTSYADLAFRIETFAAGQSGERVKALEAIALAAEKVCAYGGDYMRDLRAALKAYIALLSAPEANMPEGMKE